MNDAKAPAAVRNGAESPGDGDAAALARQHVRAAIEAVVDVMKDTEATPATRLAAAEAILNRACGKPPSALTGTAQDDLADIFASASAILAARFADPADRGGAVAGRTAGAAAGTDP